MKGLATAVTAVGATVVVVVGMFTVPAAVSEIAWVFAAPAFVALCEFVWT